MDAATAQAISQARSLRALCAEFTFGASRDAFLARLDDEIDTLFNEQVRITLLLLEPPDADCLAELLGDDALQRLAGKPASLTILDGDRNRDGDTISHRELPDLARRQGIRSVNLVRTPAAIFGSPVLCGHLLQTTDLTVIVGRFAAADETLAAGLKGIAEVSRHALHWRGGEAGGPMAAGAKAAFQHWRTLPAENDGGSFLQTVWAPLAIDQRRGMLIAGSLARLAMTADLLLKDIQAETGMLKFRQSELVRMRRGEDANASDLKEQTEILKTILDDWATTRKDDIARGNEDGVLPFDPRLLANKLTPGDLIHRQEESAAEIKYPFLKAKAFQSLVSHHYTLIPDPAAIEGIRSRLVNALDIQVRKDIDLLNQQSGELTDRLRRSAELYPAFADALKSVRLQPLQRSSFDRPLTGIALEAEVEDSYTHEGVFKRLAAGRMFASMAFSFVTMAAGVFVLFGDPSIKRGLMKFSGVIVILMILYFIFSLLIKAEEEKKLLEEKLDRIREQLNQAVMRPLAKVEQTIVKTYQGFVDEVKAAMMAAMETVTKRQSSARNRILEQRKGEDELVKGFAQRRQQAGSTVAQKVQQFITGLERARQGGAPATGAAAAAARPAAAAAASVAAQTIADKVAAVAATTAATMAARAARPAPPPPTSSPPPAPTPVRSAAMERLAALAKLRQPASTKAGDPLPTAPSTPPAAATSGTPAEDTSPSRPVDQGGAS